MIQAKGRFFNNAHRISVALNSGVTGDIADGMFLELNDSGEAIVATGTLNKRCFMTTSSRYGTVESGIGAPITADPAGRDNITSTGMVTLLVGPYSVVTDQYETGTYHCTEALKIHDTGKVEPWVTSDNPALIIGYCSKVPTVTDTTIGIIHD